MTTVAYRDGILAVDRMATFGDTYQEENGKLAIFPDRHTVVACAGDMAVVHGYLDWYRGDQKEPFVPDAWIVPDKEYFTALILSKEPLLHPVLAFSRSNILQPLDYRKYHALGNGREIALGAMWQGATAIEAVQAASDLSCFTGCGINSVNINEYSLMIKKVRA